MLVNNSLSKLFISHEQCPIKNWLLCFFVCLSCLFSVYIITSIVWHYTPTHTHKHTHTCSSLNFANILVCITTHCLSNILMVVCLSWVTYRVLFFQFGTLHKLVFSQPSTSFRVLYINSSLPFLIKKGSFCDSMSIFQNTSILVCIIVQRSLNLGGAWGCAVEQWKFLSSLCLF